MKLPFLQKLFKNRLLISICVIIYLMFPFDIIPDIVPFFGLLDDLVVVVIAIQKLRSTYGV